MRVKNIIVVLIVVISSCSNSKLNNSKYFKSVVVPYATEIQSRDISRIQDITTERGLESLLEWSDSLKDESFIERLSLDIKDFNVFSIMDSDSIVILSLGKSDNIVGATGGYLYLNKENDKYKIDLYKGGK